MACAQDQLRSLIHISIANFDEQALRNKINPTSIDEAFYMRLLPFAEPPARAAIKGHFPQVALLEHGAVDHADLNESLLKVICSEQVLSGTESIMRLYARSIRGKFEEWLDKLPDFSLRHDIGELGTESFDRILFAPSTFKHLFSEYQSPLSTQRHFIQNSILAERAKFGRSDSAVWSAMGDFYLPAYRELCQNTELPSGIVLDFSSPHGMQPIPDSNSRIDDYLPSMQGKVTAKVMESFVILQMLSQESYKFVIEVVKTVSAKVESRTGFGSSSWRHSIGKIGLTNPHIAMQTDLIHAIIHESLHSLLYAYEFNQPFCDYHKLPSSARVRSPWSGRDLPVHSYLHACLIWAALLWFWETVRLRRNLPIPEEEVNRRIATCRSGFHISPTDQLKEARDSINPNWFDLMHSITKRL